LAAGASFLGAGTFLIFGVVFFVGAGSPLGVFTVLAAWGVADGFAVVGLAFLAGFSARAAVARLGAAVFFVVTVVFFVRGRGVFDLVAIRDYFPILGRRNYTTYVKPADVSSF
jgi:hypothetical protein